MVQPVDVPGAVGAGVSSLVRAWRDAPGLLRVVGAVGAALAVLALIVITWTGSFGAAPVLLTLGFVLIGPACGLAYTLAAPRWRRPRGRRADPARRAWAALLALAIVAVLAFPLTAAHGLDPTWLWIGPGMVLVLGLLGLAIGAALDLILVLPLLVVLHRIGPEGERYRSGK